MNRYNISGLENVLAGVEEPSNQGPQGPPEDDRGSGTEVPRGGSAPADPDVSLDAPHPGPQAATPEPGLEQEAAEPVPQCSVGPDPEAIPGPGPSSNQGPQHGSDRVSSTQNKGKTLSSALLQFSKLDPTLGSSEFSSEDSVQLDSFSSDLETSQKPLSGVLKKVNKGITHILPHNLRISPKNCTK